MPVRVLEPWQWHVCCLQTINQTYIKREKCIQRIRSGLLLQTELRVRSVCLSVCLLVTFVSPAKTAEPMEMPFESWRKLVQGTKWPNRLKLLNFVCVRNPWNCRHGRISCRPSGPHGPVLYYWFSVTVTSRWAHEFISQPVHTWLVMWLMRNAWFLPRDAMLERYFLWPVSVRSSVCYKSLMFQSGFLIFSFLAPCARWSCPAVSFWAHVNIPFRIVPQSWDHADNAANSPDILVFWFQNLCVSRVGYVASSSFSRWRYHCAAARCKYH